jgi:regulator of PEP synthase PpsR (kinase-PPPase family)
MKHRSVFFISDGTAITTETLGHSLITQFPDVKFEQHRVPFVDSQQAAYKVVAQINEASDKDGAPAIVFNTIVDEGLCDILHESDGVILDLFATFLAPLEKALGVSHLPAIGQAHGVNDYGRYEDRMEATNYALAHDDGLSIEFKDADLILVGVSRSGKTPTCLYMALHFGVKAANYPLTEDDLDEMRLPPFLRRHRSKIVGLMIEPERLAQIRETRKPGSRYASLRQCHREVEAAESLLRLEGIPVFHSTHSSIEEIASRVLLQLGLQREMF